MIEPNNIGMTAQQHLRDFSPEVLQDRYERQRLLLEATGCLGAPPYDVLDLGVGSGTSAVWAARKGWRVTALDVSADNVQVLRDRLAHEADLPIRIVIGDVVECAGIPDAAFDIVFLKDLIEHVPDYQTTLVNACRKLKPGGLIYVATTNVVCPLQLEYAGVGPYSWYPAWLKDRIREYAMAKKPSIVHYTPYPAIHWFSRRSLGRALRAAGFSRIWDLYDLVRAPLDLTRRTRLIYPFIRYARYVPFGRDVVDVGVVGLTMVARK